MGDNTSTNQLLQLIVAAQAQQQQQQAQQALQKQLAQIQKDAAKASTSSAPSTSTPSTSRSQGNSASQQLQNFAVAQQIAQLAQFGQLLAAQKAQEKKAVTTTTTTPKKQTPPKPKPSTSSQPSTSSAITPGAIPGMTPEMLQAWQQAIQLQALQQMMMAPQKNQMEEAIKKMMDMAKKKPSSSTSEPSTSSAASGSSEASNGNNNVMNNVMWQLVAQQMQQKHQQQQKDSAKKAEQAKRAKELAKQQQAAKQKQDEEDAKMRQQEEIMKFLMAQQQLLLQKKQQKKQEEAAALSAKVSAEHKAALESDDPEEQKKTMEAMLRLPLQFGWKRQTCVRSIAATGIKGDVSYFAPCGKKLGTYSETVRYLTKQGIHYITRDNFQFTTKFVIGEFIVPNKTEADESRQEREFAMLTEKDINTELLRLNILKSVPKILLPSTSAAHEEEAKISRMEEPEEPLDPMELNEEFTEEQMHVMSNGIDECKVRDRESDDLLVNIHDVRHLPQFSRIENQCLSAKGFADALMVHEFVQNFGHVLGIDLETTPKLESLCAGLCGDAEKADEVLALTRRLLRLALEFPGMGNEKRFGQGGGEMGLDRENFSEVMRLFLIDKGSKELAKPLESQNFIVLTGEEKASILAFLCDELVCSRNVVTEIDRNLEEISRLKGEKWMREGKARALRQARSKKKTEEPIKEEAPAAQSDSEPPTRCVTPKKAGVPASNGTPSAPSGPTESPPRGSNQPGYGLQRKFTPGLGQCEVLTEQEESMSLHQMDTLISDLHQEAANINQKIHDTNQKIRSFPFGVDRFHRNYWMLAHTDTVLVESLESSGRHNPACTVTEYASRDPLMLEDRVSCAGIDLDVIACVEDLVDEVVLVRAKADKKTRRRYRRVENTVKRGWWTVQNRDTIDTLRSCMLSRGIRERALHRLLTKPWFLNDLRFGTLTLDPVGPRIDSEEIIRQGWRRLNLAIDKFQNHLKMSDVALSTVTGEQQAKPTVVPTTMALAQIVKDDGAWSTVESLGSDEIPSAEATRLRIVQTSEMVDPKYWRPRFRIPDGMETCQLYEDWKTYVMEEAQTTSQLMVALQALEGMIMWERSSREALCQICKSMDGDEMLVCDGCESGCHMECFRPRMTKVPEGDWFCQRCRQEKSGKPLCIFCGKESGHLHQCQRCAYHVHQDCAHDGGPKETINPDTFICPHCQEIKQMRFMKRVIMRSESEEREIKEDEQREQQKQLQKHENGCSENGHRPDQQNGNGTPKGANLKRKLETPQSPIVGGTLPKSMTKELCVLMLDELVAQTNSAPFLEPVNPKFVPGYKMVIQKPMDLKTIRLKNEKMMYDTPEDFSDDVELMFANCRQFNIDHSDIGRAGISLSKFFQKRWKQLKYNFTKRLRRLNRQS